MSFAFVFPGQGSQSVGMLGELAAEESMVRETFAEASQELGFDLWTLVSEGPAEELDRTERTQPAMLTAGVAVWRLWQARGGPAPQMLAGHSLGEYTALVCAEALEFPAAAALVEFRARCMQEAVPEGAGSMAAVLGLSPEEVSRVCAESGASGVVEPVNFNAPGQVVIAGERAAVEAALEAARAAGAKRVLPLPVSVPAHSSLMRAAAERLAQRLGDTTISAPRIPVLSTVDVKPLAEPAAIRATLTRQLHSPVRWAETVQALAAADIATVVECGPGKVLAGLNRRIEREQAVYTTHDSASFAKALAACRGSENG